MQVVSAHGRGAADCEGECMETRERQGDVPREPRQAQRERPFSRLFRRDQWRWLEPIRANPQTYHAYRVAVGTVGGLVMVLGLIMVPFPGPGWLVVFIGVSILASEFHWARRLHQWGWAKVQAWTTWIMAQPLWVRGAVATATCAFVCAVVWCTLKLTGLPAFLPAEVTAPLHQYLRL